MRLGFNFNSGPLLRVQNRYDENIGLTYAYPGLKTNKGKVIRVATNIIFVENNGHEFVYSANYNDFPYVQLI